MQHVQAGERVFFSVSGWQGVDSRLQARRASEESVVDLYIT